MKDFPESIKLILATIANDYKLFELARANPIDFHTTHVGAYRYACTQRYLIFAGLVQDVVLLINKIKPLEMDEGDCDAYVNLIKVAIIHMAKKLEGGTDEPTT